MNFIRQFAGLLRVNLSGATQRWGAVLTIIIGVTCAVGVLVSLLAMEAGARREEMGGVRDDRVILHSLGAGSIDGNVPREEATTILDLPGIKKGTNGEPVVVFEAMVPMEGRRRLTGIRIFFPLAGVTQNVAEYAPELHLTAGRMFQRGLHELVASNPCERQFEDFEIGARRSIRGVDWTIVGHFDQGDSQQCVVYADVDTLMTTFNRNTYSQVLLMLQSPAAYDVLRNAVNANPTLHLEALREREAVEDGFKQLNALFTFVGYFVGTIMAIGATLGAVNALYAIVDSRRRELATLRAIGFGPAAIMASVLCESMVLAVPGALLGGALAWIFFNGLSASPFGYSFQLAVTPSLAVTGVVWALAMGLLGGFLPALRAARVPVTTALRAT
jgi:putative ABC transport system permease protein